MKVGRRKKASRILTFFRYRFGYLPPYAVLMDGTFCQAALQFKLNLREQMPKYFSNEVEIFTTKCVLHELEELGGELRGALAVAKEYSVAKCPHKPMRSAVECLKHMARRSKFTEHRKYFIATQDNTLLQSVRELAGVPLLSIRYNTILLEKPSNESVAQESKDTSELEKLRQLKADVLGEPKKKKKDVKGPNPLSCKKKKSEVLQQPKLANAKDESAKRKRVRKRKSKLADESGASDAEANVATKKLAVAKNAVTS